jgi:serine/threonine protein kinase
VYDIGEAEDSIYLSMEYVNGEDLASLLRRIKECDTR